MIKQKVIIGISGGIDSAASAYQLKKEGYEVIGVTFNFLEAESTLKAARLVADTLQIEHHVVAAQDQFRKKVIAPFVEGYKKGQTPNPCMLCNQELKFKLLRQWSQKNDDARIATGHYAEIEKVGSHYKLLASRNARKDQSYFLYHLDQDVLSRLLLPLDQFESKEAVRQTIRALLPELSVGSESQGICFIPAHNHALFLKEAVWGSRPTEPGNFVDLSGKIIGRHRGIQSYTLGQARGLGLRSGKRLVVADILPKTNTIVLAEEAALYRKEIIIEALKLQPGEDLSGAELAFKTCRWGKLYYGQLEQLTSDQALVHCQDPVRAPTPGQALVFYRDRQVLGGGLIKKNLNSSADRL